MNIEILDMVEGARQAKGLTVVIDVFRAFSVTCYAFDEGAAKVYSVGDLELAYKLKEKHPEYLLVGEREEKLPPGFDIGNSPSHLLKTKIKGKTLIHTTSAGTQGIVNAVNADEVLTGSFVNAEAIVHYIRNKNPRHVSLVCMGYGAKYPTEEDTFCAHYIRDRLENKQTDFESMVKKIRTTSGRRFFIPEKQDFAPEADFRLCLNLNRFRFVLRAHGNREPLLLEKIDVH